MPRSEPPPRPCRRQVVHTIHPAGYVAHSEWADQMMLTHDQKKCPGCDFWEVWEPKPGVGDLSRPALRDGECVCGEYYELGALIRTDDAGWWIGPCCPEVAHA